MMEIATLLMLCALFAALAAFAVTAALKAARVENLLGEVFSPWLHGPFGDPGTGGTSQPGSLDELARHGPRPYEGELSESLPTAATSRACG